MADLVPHPLVITVAIELGKPGAVSTSPPSTFERAVTAVKMVATKVSGGNAAAVDTGDDDLAEAQNRVAREFANQANAPAVSLFAGYLGGPVDHDGNEWRLLYLDALLADWMLIQVTDIVAHERLETENAPAGVIDVLWVKATANLVTGSGPRANTGRFLVGEFTRAGDFAPSTRGGTFSAASGLLCQATTPGCCRPSRTTCH
jgi:hypothetical protein